MSAVPSRLDVAYPGCWYWVDAASTPVRDDPDEPGEANAEYRALDWADIGGSARRAVLMAERSGPWDRRRAIVKQPIELESAERFVLDDWLWARPPLSSLLNDPADPMIFDGRHRLWLAGKVGAWPLPVLNVELSDLVHGDLTGHEAIDALVPLERTITSSSQLADLNARHLETVRRALLRAHH